MPRSIVKLFKISARLFMVLFAVILFASCTGSTTMTNPSITESLNTSSHSFTLSYTTTPKGSQVQTCIYSKPLTKDEKNAINKQMAALISKLKWDSVKKSEPAFYNCHSYAWKSQSSSNNMWINQFRIDPSTKRMTTQANLSKFWTDGSYSLVIQKTNLIIPSNVPNGSPVFYKNGDHSAIKYSSSKFRSKWGLAGVYEHSPGCAPYSASVLEYYKKN